MLRRATGTTHIRSTYSHLQNRRMFIRRETGTGIRVVRHDLGSIRLIVSMLQTGVGRVREDSGSIRLIVSTVARTDSAGRRQKCVVATTLRRRRGREEHQPAVRTDLVPEIRPGPGQQPAQPLPLREEVEVLVVLE